jgi:hypothetical protein
MKSRRMDSPTATTTAGQQAPERRGTNSRERRHDRRRLEHAIETASVERQRARACGDAGTAYSRDVDLLGRESAQQLADNTLRKTRVGRGRARKGAYDPYTRERAEGLHAERRLAGGPQ